MGALWKYALVILYGACLLASATASQVFLTSFLLEDPHVLQSKAAPYFRCLGGDLLDIHYPSGVVATGVRYNYTGAEDFQPVMDMPFGLCPRCGFFITDFVFGGESSMGTFEMCRTHFPSTAPVAYQKAGSFAVTFTCPTCANAIAPPPPSPAPKPAPSPTGAPRASPAPMPKSSPSLAPKPSSAPAPAPGPGASGATAVRPPPGRNPTAGVVPQSPPMIIPADQKPGKGGGGFRPARVLLWLLAAGGLSYVAWYYGRNWVDRIRARRRINNMEHFGHLFVALQPDKHESELNRMQPGSSSV